MSDRLNANTYFRSFDQLAGKASTQAHVENEFPGYDPKEISSMPRRKFMKLMGATMAVAGVGLTGCRRWPKEHLVPSTAGLRDQTPGVPEFYATAVERNGVADAILVTSYDGRPLKIEGNPLHPLYTSWRTADGKPLIGASDVLTQASIHDMYDPARSRVVVDNTAATPKPSTWDAFYAAFGDVLKQNPSGAGVAILSEASSSLTTAATRARFLQKHPRAIWAEYEPLTLDEETEASKEAFNKAGVRAVYHLDKARTIVSLDGDLLGAHPNKVRHSNDWSAGRRSADTAKSMNRLYIAETAMTVTGSVADHRLPVKPSQVSAVAVALAAALGVAGLVAPAELTDAQKKWVAAAAADLKTSGRAGVVVVGLQASPQVQALAYAINFALNAAGNTVTFHQMPEPAAQLSSLRTLLDQLGRGAVQALLILGGNPAYNAPADLDFATRIKSVRLTAHLSHYQDETSRLCQWHLPRSHFLESWGDVRTWDGSVTIQQPLILPLGDTRTTPEVLAALLGEANIDGQAMVRQTFAGANGLTDEIWRVSLHDGLIKNSAYPPAPVQAPSGVSAAVTQASGEFELRFLPSSQTYDGRYANNGWLLECPDPITKLVWDNAALMNKSDADRLGLEHGSLIDVKVGSSLSLQIPVYVLWGQPKGVIGLQLGFGRTAAGPIGGDTLLTDSPVVGFDTFKLRGSNSGQLYYVFNGVSVSKAAGEHLLVTTQDFQAMDWPGKKGYVERAGTKNKSGAVIREGSLAEYIAKPDFVNYVGHRLPLQQLWDSPYPSEAEQRESAQRDPGAPHAFNRPHAWGMAIDMSTCTGCMACVVACQSENNIPIVGKQQVKMNRDMHWIRIDRYFKARMDARGNVTDGDYENVDVVHQPMMCVHCENAPCEQVCPVAATVHDTEGLNTMVYNRCIGTRYCSNNCPYKVRRFNYMDWHSRNPRADGPLGLLASAWLGIPDQQQKESIEKVRQMIFNPEVTVRMRGVMEKCTYCTQRIKAATIQRKAEWAKGNIPDVEKPNGQPAYTVDDFEVVTACQQACPTQAITFGNLLDRNSAVRKLHEQPRTYTVLEELNTRARTRHMAKITNPNESLLEAADGAAPAPAEHT
jgi:MoCo/4Fe-4S cofactor protein with predicted Tat translocation signal